MKNLLLITVAVLILVIVFDGVHHYSTLEAQVNLVPQVSIYSRGTLSGVVTVNAATTSNVFTAVAAVRNYVTQAACMNQSATAVFATIYDGATALAIVPCPTSLTTGAVPITTFNPPLEGSAGVATSVGVTTAGTNSRVALNGFRGVR